MAKISVLVLCTAVFWNGGEAKPRREAVDEAEGYVTYISGTGLPIVLSAPHGGSLEPSHIPTRDYGCWDGNQCVWSHDCGVKDRSRCKTTTVKDMFTYELTKELRQELCTLMNVCPAAILNELHRRKFDANRDKAQGTFGVQVVEEAFDLYHQYIDDAKSEIQGMGLFFDIHGHGHELQRAELGYLISGSKLDSGEFEASGSSISNLAANVNISFDDLLRGAQSFGGFLQAEGFDAVPGPSYPGPSGNVYFSGGYNTKVHGSRDQGMIDAIQIESARSHREMPQRETYVRALAISMMQYLEAYYSINMTYTTNSYNGNMNAFQTTESQYLDYSWLSEEDDDHREQGTTGMNYTTRNTGSNHAPISFAIFLCTFFVVNVSVQNKGS